MSICAVRRALSVVLVCGMGSAICAEASADPVAWWRFEGTGAVGAAPNVLSPGFLDAQGSGGTTYQTSTPGAFVFDPFSGQILANASSLDAGQGHGASVADNDALDAASFTIEAFVLIGGDQGSYPAYISYVSPSGPRLGWQLDMDPGEEGRTRFDTTAKTNQVAGSNAGQALGVGQWHHVAVTFNASSGLIEYYNDYGNRATATLSGTASEATAVAADLILGNNGGLPGGTLLDEVRYSNSVLSPNQFLRTLAAPEGSIDTDLTGLSTQIVRVNNNLDNMGQVASAMNLKPGDGNHSASQVRVVDRVDLDTAGSRFSGQVGLFPGDGHSSAAGPEDYAVQMAGYVYAPSAGYTRTFAVDADDGYELRIGGSSFLSGTGTTPQLVTVTFPEAGYWSIDVLYRNRGGGAGLEVSSAAGEVTSFNTTDFQILGADAAFPVYQRPDAMPADGDWGFNAAGAPAIAGTVDAGLADGLNVTIHARPGGSANIDDAMMFSRRSATPAAAIKSLAVDFRDPQNGSEGSFAGTPPWPHNTGSDDNYFTTAVGGLMYFPEPGDYAFAVGSDDGFRLRVGDQIIGKFSSGRGHPGGTANTGFVHIPQSGLYPVELYHYENSGGSSVELSFKQTSDLLQSSRDPNAAGYGTDLSARAFAVTPKAELRRVGHKLFGKAYTEVDALAVSLPSETWVLHEVVQNGQARMTGLVGQYYGYAGGSPAWDDGLAPLGTRGDFTGSSSAFNFGDNYAYNNPSPPGWGNLEDQFGVRWTGYLDVPETGTYSFYMASDDRSWMFIDLDGDGVLEAGPEQNTWHSHWYDLELAEGLHKVEFRAREFSGGESARLQWITPGETGWSDLTGAFFVQDLYDGALLPLASGTNDMLGSEAWDELLASFDLGTEARLRLTSIFAGQIAVAEADFVFVPEPGTLVLLALGAAAVGLRGLRRRRRP